MSCIVEQFTTTKRGTMQRKTTSSSIPANARETARAFADLAAALRRRLEGVMELPKGSDEVTRARAALQAGALTAGERSFKGRPPLKHAAFCAELTASTWRGLFRANPDADAQASADLWPHEPEQDLALVTSAAEALAQVMGALAVELEALDAAEAAATTCRARRAA